MSDKRYEANIIRATAVEPANNLQSTSAPGVWSIDEVVELQKKEKWPTVGNVITNVEQVFSTFLYEGNGANQVIENGIALGNSNDGGSVEFDGTGDYLNLSTPVVPASGQFSLEAFIYPTATTDEAIASQHADGETGRFIFRLDNGKLNFNWAASELTDANSITANAWSHCLVTRDASNVIRLFVNGALRKSTTNSVTLNQNNFTIGASRIASPEKFFNGFISNVRVVSGAIPTEYQTSSTTEGAAIYTTPTTGLTAVSNTALLTCQGSTPLVDNSSNSYAITTNADAAARAFGPFTGTGGEGGLVWTKNRDDSYDHNLVDSARGLTNSPYIRSNTSGIQGTDGNGITAFNNNGYTVGSSGSWNANGNSHVSWTFRKAAKFFDVVTYSGTGSARTVSHSLGSVPGMILIKNTSGSTGNWRVYHRGMNGGTNPEQYSMRLNQTNAQASDSAAFNDTAPTSSVFTVGTSATNESGRDYIAYLFAHNNNDGEFGPDQDEDIIKCGSYTGNGSTTGVFQDLGFEPQWIMCKVSSSTDGWILLDNMRGVGGAGSNDPRLEANTDSAEANGEIMKFDATGFTPLTADGKINGSGKTYIYMAIRRPQAAPTAASQVFSVATYSSNGNSNIFNTGFNVDMAITTRTSGTNRYNLARLMGSKYLFTEANNAEGDLGTQWYARNNSVDFSTSFWGTTNNTVIWSWARARGYFDVVCYTGTASARTIAHNLGVAPEMMWVKCRDGPGGTGASYWVVYHKDLDASAPEDKAIYLDTTTAAFDFAGYWNDTAPTSTVFTLGTGNGNDTNASGQNYISYLFATLPGISKVGSYTGSSSAVDVDCGFTSGARFILIKRSSASGDGWFTFDSVRGIVAGNDPFLYLNDQQAEFTSYDAIDPYSAGFTVTTALGGLNTNGSTYVFYAIAQ